MLTEVFPGLHQFTICSGPASRHQVPRGSNRLLHGRPTSLLLGRHARHRPLPLRQTRHSDLRERQDIRTELDVPRGRSIDVDCQCGLSALHGDWSRANGRDSSVWSCLCALDNECSVVQGGEMATVGCVEFAGVVASSGGQRIV